MNRTFVYNSHPCLRSCASVVGKKEGEGPLGGLFDEVEPDDLFGEESWEKAESRMLIRAANLCARKGGCTVKAVNALLMGDLLNQITASSFAARELAAPFIGLYGACSTMIEGIMLGAALVDAGFVENCLAAASSHFCSAERQYRFPLELGNQRPPSAQWTATASGAVLLDRKPDRGLCRATHATMGRVVDYAVSDVNHMGAAMAPAVADTLAAHFLDTGRTPADYGLIVTGDLGKVGRRLFIELARQRGAALDDKRVFDCGENMFSASQSVQSGASGCGCVASVLAAKIIPALEKREIASALVLGSGAMLSPTTSAQGESIPAISYCVALEAEK